ncbi:nitrite/sulfite reductase [Pseudoteredinibacter isoporae]|uniref:Sulfite reductase (NADPH) hemoprotein beta-component n=1 Tax=Pseudoteredinibacter isoporae TaxID=570281 RepID=A0A7X0JVW8_9GAMM|nr:nitrite/sulfite reductase [Pseudoteredinibacter isoporae]MBB6523213.1 sulfite reductase (NADPH) hemoprotein beta-component [Pseudoteredinibacter isoporae]NHO88730.1 nitrite/sulfite reductase [Pseudoteredinibacter isoporae]NIB22579.1 nitrite/sulfite reductase [Pseudoteredinibacter isoporae]
MYIYDQHDHSILRQRVEQFRQQTERYLSGDLAEEAFLPLRLQNGLYVQRLAPMLRVNVPYGMINSGQLRRVARVARDYDKGYVHISTRQNIQFNWPDLADVPAILAELAEVEMHATQSSGNCIRNTTADQFAGIAEDELLDPRPYCEIIRQWSTLHPEFAFLPRKFKIAVNAAKEDRAASQVHDIGLDLYENEAGETGFRVRVGGGLGRTPLVGSVIREFLPEQELLSYLDAVLRVYNQKGRRDNKYKARIKILVKAMGPEAFAELVEEEWQRIRDGYTRLTREEIERAKSFFTEPAYKSFDSAAVDAKLDELRAEHKAFDKWLTRNVRQHKKADYASVTLSLKPTGVAPGDVTDKQLEIIADLADEYSFGEARTTHEQNIVLGDVEKDRLFELWEKVKAAGFATPNIGTMTDIICCPGGDYCSLANAKSIPIADAIQRRFSDMDYLYDLGDLDLNISGCMNACAHHHVGHIGILGVDKKGQEFYQVQLGGNAGNDTKLGKVLGPAFEADEIPLVLEKILNIFVENRIEGEEFLQTYQRIGMAPFKERVYAKDH